MKIKPFKLERYFARYEFSAKYLLCSSDCESLKQEYVLALADEETRHLWQNLALGYTESQGNPLLRREIAEAYSNISADNVLVSAPEEGIYLALNSILDKGDHVICTFPGYQSLYQIAENNGCRVTRWLPEEENGWRFNPDFLESAIRKNTKLLVINFPHNPTGSLPSRGDFERIIEIARERKLYIFSDEMYRGLEYKPQDRLPAMCEVYPEAISLGGMSKAYGMPGVRIGWLASQNRLLLKRMAAFKDYTTICNNAPGEVLSLIALRAKERILAEQLARIKRNVGLLDKFFIKNQNICSWVRPKAGTIAFPRLKLEMGSMEFCRKSVEEAGIMLLPSSVYDYQDSHFRIGFGRENLPETLKHFQEYLDIRQPIL